MNNHFNYTVEEQIEFLRNHGIEVRLVPKAFFPDDRAWFGGGNRQCTTEESIGEAFDKVHRRISMNIDPFSDDTK